MATRLGMKVFAGAVGGLAGSFVMNQFQALLSSAQSSFSADEPQSETSEAGDDATVKTAAMISKTLFSHNLSKEEKSWAGPAVHYGFGTLVGALYGLASAQVPYLSAGAGTAFGTAVWLGADELGVPAAGLSGNPLDSPMSSHASALAAHLVYGLTTDTVRRVVVKLASAPEI